MPLRHVALGQDDVVALHAADRDLGLVEHQAALLTAFFRQDDREHGLSRADVAGVKERAEATPEPEKRT